MDFVTRLKQYIDFTGLAVSQFADTAQIPRPTLSQILNGRNKKISNELIAKLHEGFPRLNILWMLFGDGSMEISDNSVRGGASYQNRVDFSGDDPSDSCVAEYEEQAPYGSDRGLFSAMTSDNSDAADYSQRHTGNDAHGGYSRQNLTGSDRSVRNSPTPEAQNSRHNERQEPGNQALNLNPSMAVRPDSTKRVQSIMVFYTDNSFEIFTPSASK